MAKAKTATKTKKKAPIDAEIIKDTPKKKRSTKKQPKIIRAAMPAPEVIVEVQHEIDKQQRIKRRKLTIKEVSLIRGVIAGKTKRQAAMDAGYSGTPEVVSVTASKVLSKANVQEAMQQALAKHNLTPDRLAGVVADALGATKVMIIGNGEDAMADVQPDHAIRLRAADMAGKFMGVGKTDEDESKNGSTTIIFNQQNNLNRYMNR